MRPAVRAPFERALGHGFGDVRVHAGPSAEGTGARASTSGNEITFPPGQYAPDTGRGRWLLAHELAHVAQQARGGTTPDAEERADVAADQLMRGESVDAAALGGSAVGVQLGPPEATDTEAEPAPKAAEAGKEAATRTSGSGLDHFKRDSATLTKEHVASLDQLAWGIGLHLGMLQAGRASVHIVGHTDTTGTEKHNSGLGQGRADSVKAALTEALKKNNVPEAQLDPITTTSAGEADLVVPTDDNVDEPLNRRVHIEVTITAAVPPSQKPPVNLNLPPGWEPPASPGGQGLPKGPGPAAPTPSRSWLEEALKRDDLLKQLPPRAREKAIDALKDIDETAVDKVLDAVPWDDKQKAAAKAALKALFKTLKGGKFKPPEPPPRGPEFGPEPEFQKLPGEKIFKLPPIRFNWP